MESLRPVTDRSSTCAHLGARNGQLPILQWIVMQAGVPTLRGDCKRVGSLHWTGAKSTSVWRGLR